MPIIFTKIQRVKCVGVSLGINAITVGKSQENNDSYRISNCYINHESSESLYYIILYFIINLCKLSSYPQFHGTTKCD